ncbi:hypothetical protein OF83DRAFT_813399 [Amylostereum chailletii]|nr:hypothetical protein OF83DRAFT_813399 [Amylostereum chailletii]
MGVELNSEDRGSFSSLQFPPSGHPPFFFGTSNGSFLPSWGRDTLPASSVITIDGMGWDGLHPRPDFTSCVRRGRKKGVRGDASTGARRFNVLRSNVRMSVGWRRPGSKASSVALRTYNVRARPSVPRPSVACHPGSIRKADMCTKHGTQCDGRQLQTGAGNLLAKTGRAWHGCASAYRAERPNPIGRSQSGLSPSDRPFGLPPSQDLPRFPFSPFRSFPFSLDFPAPGRSPVPTAPLLPGPTVGPPRAPPAPTSLLLALSLGSLLNLLHLIPSHTSPVLLLLHHSPCIPIHVVVGLIGPNHASAASN